MGINVLVEDKYFIATQQKHQVGIEFFCRSNQIFVRSTETLICLFSSKDFVGSRPNIFFSAGSTDVYVQTDSERPTFARSAIRLCCILGTTRYRGKVRGRDYGNELGKIYNIQRRHKRAEIAVQHPREPSEL